MNETSLKLLVELLVDRCNYDEVAAAWLQSSTLHNHIVSAIRHLHNLVYEKDIESHHNQIQQYTSLITFVLSNANKNG